MSQQAAPVELYKITCGDETWLYTSNDKNYTHVGLEYIAVPMGRSSIESKGQVKKENLEVSFAVNNPMAKNFLMYTPDQMVYLTVYIIKEGGGGNYIGWKGRLSATKPNKSQITLIFESVYTSIKSSLLTQSYQRNCRHMIYSTMGCRVNKSAYEEVATVASINGYNLYLTAIPTVEEGYYVGGIVQYQGSARGIMATNGSHITLSDVWPSLREAVGLANGIGTTVEVSLFPGCDRTMPTCLTKFDNLDNFGGFPYIPLKNPFGSSIT